MKSTYFRKPLEFSIEVVGEKWSQGDKVTGTVSIKNHSDESIDLSDFGIFLCNGDLKKVQKSDPKGLEVMGESIFSTDEHSFEFVLDENCPTTQKSSGPYIVCAQKNELLSGNLLALQVGPSAMIANILEVLENFMRFKVKSLKPKKGLLEATIILPATKEYTSITSYKIQIKNLNNSLVLDNHFKIKKVSFEGGVTSTKDETKKICLELKPSEYLIYGSSLNQDFIVQKMNEVIDQVKLKPIL